MAGLLDQLFESLSAPQSPWSEEAMRRLSQGQDLSGIDRALAEKAARPNSAPQATAQNLTDYTNGGRPYTATPERQEPAPAQFPPSAPRMGASSAPGGQRPDFSSSNGMDFGKILGGLGVNPALIEGLGIGGADRSQMSGLVFDALQRKGMDPKVAEIVSRRPEYLKAMLPQLMQNDAKFSVIGNDQFGNPQHGWVDSQRQTVTPATVTTQPGQGQDTAALTSGKTGDEFLKNVDKPTADQLRAISEGRVAYPSGMALKTPYWQRMTALLSQYDPQFDAVNYGARAGVRKDFTSGKSAANLTSFNTLAGHLDTLEKAADGLNNNNTLPILNGPINTVMGAVSSDTQSRLKKFETAKTAVVDELTRAFRGSGGSVHDIQTWERAISSADSPQALQAAIGQAKELIRSRIESVGEQYHRGMGLTKDPLDILTPKAREIFDRAGKSKTLDAQPASSPQAAPQQPNAQPQQNAPPAPGAKQAPDGNWYVPDTTRPGKYLQVGR